MTKNPQGLRINIQGIVQGVGFRPFIYNLANKYKLKGWVRNNSKGVEIEVSGSPKSLKLFTENIHLTAPPLSKITNFTTTEIPPTDSTSFEIENSTSNSDDFVLVSPDISVCDDCLREFFNPHDRRYLYPFINCTNCGPRFTIIKDTPYDRPFTSMAEFPMCQQCSSEYNDPTDRRFHAQPIACPDCGPNIWIEFPLESKVHTNHFGSNQSIIFIQEKLKRGAIVAIKGLGGFHLACDALNQQAVSKLRSRKNRISKPLAIMMANIELVDQNCYLSEAELMYLNSPEKPILILKKRPESRIVQDIAPGQNTIGVMLPYTPLHHLLFKQIPGSEDLQPCLALVMTSGNISDEPIAYENTDAKERLSEIADNFLMNDRPIHVRCDDSLIQVPDLEPNPVNSTTSSIFTIRRARGYAPSPLELPWTSIQLLAVGAELKNSICITNDKYAFLSQYIGDLQNYETYTSFEKTISHFESIYRSKPKIITCDLHPDYLSTRYAFERAASDNLPVFQVQHHHAHITSVMAENGVDEMEPVIGLAFDGTGYGDDNNIWGGEILISTYKSYQRAFHLEYFPLPGGDLAVQNPSRTALALLWKTGYDWLSELPPVAYYCAEDLLKIKMQLEHRINTPMTSSMGRLFDAVASLLNINQRINYEAQAAIELESICDPDEKSTYEIEFIENQIIVSNMCRSIVEDILKGLAAPIVSAKFHNTLVSLSTEAVENIYKQTGIRTVALSGGVWQNKKLFESVYLNLRKRNFTVLYNQKIPTNDGGIALGQASTAHHLYKDSS